MTTGSPGVVVLIAQAMTPEPGSKSGPLAAWPRRAVVRAGLAAATLGMVPVAACAQDYPEVTYPTRAVRIIVPFPAGGTADLMPRIVADWLSRKWKQAVMIENKAGAAGNIGAEAAFNAEPDGYTLLASPAPPLVINQSLYPKLGFDPSAFVAGLGDGHRAECAGGQSRARCRRKRSPN